MAASVLSDIAVRGVTVKMKSVQKFVKLVVSVPKDLHVTQLPINVSKKKNVTSDQMFQIVISMKNGTNAVANVLKGQSITVKP